MRSALESVPGVGKLDYTAGQRDFRVHYDANKVTPQAIAAACEKAGHPVTITK